MSGVSTATDICDDISGMLKAIAQSVALTV